MGPEPTTDRFVAIMRGADHRITPGNALATRTDLPYESLQRFGVSFLNHFQSSELPNPLLDKVTFVDSPGILSGEKERLNREYDIANIASHFAAQADLILLLFDANKLDISDEFRQVIQGLRGNEDKIRCVLNKADEVATV